MTIWVPVFVQSIPSHPYPSLRIEHSFKSTVLTFRSSCSRQTISWRRAGYICPILQLPGIDEPSHAPGRRLKLGTQTLRFDNLSQPFQLELFPDGRLSDLTLIIWEPDPPILDLDLEIDFGSTNTPS